MLVRLNNIQGSTKYFLSIDILFSFKSLFSLFKVETRCHLCYSSVCVTQTTECKVKQLVSLPVCKSFIQRLGLFHFIRLIHFV